MELELEREVGLDGVDKKGRGDGDGRRVLSSCRFVQQKSPTVN